MSPSYGDFQCFLQPHHSSHHSITCSVSVTTSIGFSPIPVFLRWSPNYSRKRKADVEVNTILRALPKSKSPPMDPDAHVRIDVTKVHENPGLMQQNPKYHTAPTNSTVSFATLKSKQKHGSKQDVGVTNLIGMTGEEAFRLSKVK